MDCTRFEEDISAYVDGELEPQEARGIEEHLASCECCRDLRDQMTAMKTAVSELPEPDIAPEDLWSFAPAATSAQPNRILVVVSRVAAVAMIAVASFAFGIAFSTLQQRSGQLPSTAGSIQQKEAAPTSPETGDASDTGPKGAGEQRGGYIGGDSEGTLPPSGSTATEYGSPDDGGSSASGQLQIKIEPFSGPKPHGAAFAYRITAGKVAVMVGIDRRGRVLVVKPIR